MTKAELVEFIAENADLTKADAARALEAVVEGITEGGIYYPLYYGAFNILGYYA